MLLMDRFFLRERGIDRRAITALDRLAYMGDRAMGAFSCAGDIAWPAG
jgi:serine/threonine-protein kinase HipA